MRRSTTSALNVVLADEEKIKHNCESRKYLIAHCAIHWAKKNRQLGGMFLQRRVSRDAYMIGTGLS